MIAKLQYFKLNGKWYSDADLEVNGDLPLYEIWEYVRKLRDARTLPGLIPGHGDYHITVDVPGHRHEHPALLLCAQPAR